MKHTAIFNLYPDVVSIDGIDEAFDSNGSRVNIDQTLVSTEVQRLQAEYDANQYQRDRAAEYPSIEDQLDALYHKGIDGWKIDIKAIKDKHPKV